MRKHKSKEKLTGARELLKQEIARREAVEEELLRAQKLESFGVFAGGIAHDFNNALAAILNHIHIAKIFIEPGSAAYKTLEAAARAAHNAKSLTRQLLTFSKGGKLVKKVARIEELIIEELIKDTVELVTVGADIRCEFDIADDLWPVKVDSSQIGQVIGNLAINAAQAMPQGGVIRVRAGNIILGKDDVLPLSGGKYLKLSVKDRGTGIPEEHLSRVFDPYFSTKEHGSGLGLAYSYLIIKNHGGHITVESRAGRGATFYVYLPVRHKLLTS